MLNEWMFTALRAVFESSLRTIVKVIQASNLALDTKNDFAELSLKKKSFEFSLLTSIALLQILFVRMKYLPD